ncbi:hypothetical protein PIIN_11546 [Serendipita indica DSM 11827]|uniref:Uncharacterized protein n=1 Tax=Serendipita indica (strain DSM 11827) TaxID=1109443 RepID=G4U1X6_SERID|nr:hypothetical protein PIIN_11546 [Serendipita indica DSM 11827]
MSSVPNGVKGT